MQPISLLKDPDTKDEADIPPPSNFEGSNAISEDNDDESGLDDSVLEYKGNNQSDKQSDDNLSEDMDDDEEIEAGQKWHQQSSDSDNT